MCRSPREPCEDGCACSFCASLGIVVTTGLDDALLVIQELELANRELQGKLGASNSLSAADPDRTVVSVHKTIE